MFSKWKRALWSAPILLLFVGFPAAAWTPLTAQWKYPRFSKVGSNWPKHYIMVTLANTQSSATATNLPVKVTINSNTNSAKYAATLLNANWQLGDGTILKSWLESGETNTSTSSVYWINLGSKTIAATTGKLVIYQVIYDTTANVFDGTNTGAEPQFTGTYGQYDNGAQVFSLYDNFAGTTINAMWTKYNTSRGTYTQNNGINLKVTSTNLGGNYGMYAAFTPNAAGTYIRQKVTCVTSGDGLTYGLGNSTTGASTSMQNGYAFISGSSFNTKISLWKLVTASTTALIQTVNDALVTGTTYVTEGYWAGTTLYANNITNAHSTTVTDSTYALGSVTQVLMAVLTLNNVEFKWYYFIAAISPPNGVLPSASAATINAY